MEHDKSIKEFTKTFRRVLTLLSILECNLEDYKDLRWHKEYPPEKIKGKEQPSLKTDAAELLNAVRAYYVKTMNRTSSTIWNEIKADISRDQLHKISLLVQEVTDLRDIDLVTEEIIEIKKRDNPQM